MIWKKREKIKELICGMYNLILKLNLKEYKAEGDDLYDALLLIKPECYKTKGFLTVNNGDKEITRILNIPQMKRIFGSGGQTTQKIALECNVKWLKVMLGEIKIGKSNAI